MQIFFVVEYFAYHYIFFFLQFMILSEFTHLLGVKCPKWGKSRAERPLLTLINGIFIHLIQTVIYVSNGPPALGFCPQATVKRIAFRKTDSKEYLLNS